MRLKGMELFVIRLFDSLHIDLLAVEGDRHFKYLADTGLAERGGVLFVFDLPEGGVEDGFDGLVVQRVVELEFDNDTPFTQVAWP